MNLSLGDSVIRWLGGLLAYTTRYGLYIEQGQEVWEGNTGTEKRTNPQNAGDR